MADIASPLNPLGDFPVATSSQIGRPAGGTVEKALQTTEADAVPTKELLSKVRPLRLEVGVQGARWRIGNRVFATLDQTVGFYFRKVRLPANATIDDQPGIPMSQRLLSSPVGQFLKRPSGELAGPESTLRWKIGNRLFVTLDAASGLFPRKLTLPMSAKLEDGGVLVKRLVGLNVGDNLKSLPVELGTGGIRWRTGNRLLMTLDVARGLYSKSAA